MIRKSQIALVAFTALMMFLTACRRSDSEDKVIDVAPDNPEMVAAIAKARATLPEFWKVFDKPDHGETEFSLKVKISDKGGTEYFWVIDLERKDGKIFGAINNDPDYVKKVKLGDRIEIPQADISDWLYMRNGKMVGNETVRPLLKQMSADEAARLRSIMADP